VVQRKIEELQQTICQMQKDHKKEREETWMQCKVALERAEEALEQAEERHNKASNERDRLASENKKLIEELKEYNDAFNQAVEASSSPWWMPSVFISKNRSKPSPLQFMEAVKKQGASLEGEIKSLKEDVGQKKAKMVCLQTELDRAQQLHHETVASLEGEVKSLKEDVGQKKAGMVWLQTELDRAQQLHHETVASLEGEVKSLKEDVGQKKAGMVWLQTELDRAQQLHHETDEKLYQCLCAVKSFVLDSLKPDLEECMCKTTQIKAYLDDSECQNPGKSNETKFKVEYLHPGSEPNIQVITCSDQCHNIFKDLVSRASERFEHFGLAKEQLFFQYTDSEGDTISVSSRVELKEAIYQFQSSTPELKLRLSPPSEMDQQAGSGVTTDEAAGRS
jgi:DNA repair exonuclease SbcCD ATPase subunit